MKLNCLKESKLNVTFNFVCPLLLKKFIKLRLQKARVKIKLSIEFLGVII